MRLGLRERRIALLGFSFWILVVLLWPGATISRGSEELVISVATTLGLIEGEESLRAVELAAAEINRNGGIRVGDRRLAVRVNAADLRDALPGVSVDHALSILEKMIIEERPAAIVVGPFRSEVLLPSMDIIAKHRVPMLGTIAMSPASEIKMMKNPDYRYVFRMGLNSRYLVAYLIDAMKFLHARFGFTKVFIMAQDVAWARTTASLMRTLYFDRAAWEVMGMENYPNGCEDYSPGLSRAREQGVQVILPIFDMPQSGILVKQWNSMKIPALMMGFISPLAGPGAWKTFDGKISGAINCIFELGSAIASEKVPLSVAFCTAYERAFGRAMEAGHGPAAAYESIYVLAEAIERRGSLDPEKIVVALEETDRMGAMGRIRFHKGHQVIFGKDPGTEAVACLFQWTDDGQRRIVYPPLLAEGEIQMPQGLSALLKK